MNVLRRSHAEATELDSKTMAVTLMKGCKHLDLWSISLLECLYYLVTHAPMIIQMHIQSHGHSLIALCNNITYSSPERS